MKDHKIRIRITRELLWFLVPTFVLTYIVALAGHLRGGLDHFPVMAISMYIPATIVILLYKLKFKKPIFRKNDLGLTFKGFKYWIFAPLFLFFIISATYVLPGFFVPDFYMSSAEILELTEKTGVSVGSWGLNLTFIFMMNILVAPVLNILMFLGEEIAWRGYLVPRLLTLFGPKKSFLIGGSIWALWHAGGILLGFNYPGHPLLGNFMMIIMCIPLGIILQYLYVKSQSIFVPALAHGAINWTASTFGMFTLSSDQYNTMLYGPTGVFGIAILSLVAIILFKQIPWKEENPISVV